MVWIGGLDFDLSHWPQVLAGVSHPGTPPIQTIHWRKAEFLQSLHGTPKACGYGSK